MKFQRARSRHQSTEAIRCTLSVLFLWPGWLRLMELFSLTKRDIELTLPKDGAIYNLPEGVGALGLKLLARTKASQTRRADV